MLIYFLMINHLYIPEINLICCHYFYTYWWIWFADILFDNLVFLFLNMTSLYLKIFHCNIWVWCLKIICIAFLLLNYLKHFYKIWITCSLNIWQNFSLNHLHFCRGSIFKLTIHFLCGYWVIWVFYCFLSEFWLA